LAVVHDFIAGEAAVDGLAQQAEHPGQMFFSTRSRVAIRDLLR
jgi:hypothetical protein